MLWECHAQKRERERERGGGGGRGEGGGGGQCVWCISRGGGGVCVRERRGERCVGVCVSDEQLILFIYLFIYLFIFVLHNSVLPPLLNRNMEIKGSE